MRFQRIKSLKNEEWECVHDVIEFPNIGIVFACSEGLFHVDNSANTINEIDIGEFTSVHVYKGIVFAFEYGSNMIRTYTYGDTWLTRRFVDCSKIMHDYGFTTISVIERFTQTPLNTW